MATIINVQCADQTLQVLNNPKIASGSQQENEMQFNFCSNWDGFTKTAIFYKEETQCYNVLLVDDKCIVPNEVLQEEGEFYFGVYGINGVVRRTSEVKKYKVVKGSFVEGSVPSEPTPDIYEQILTACAKMEKDANEIKELYSESLTMGDLEVMIDDKCRNVISNAQQTAEEIAEEITNKKLDSYEERLTNLGFKEGTFAVEGGGAVLQNTITKQGKYAIGNLSMLSATSFTAPKLSVPDEFKPANNTSIVIAYLTSATISVYTYKTATLNTDGTITGLEDTNMLQMSIINAGWQIN